MDCPNCGKQVDDDAPLCPNCGFDIHSRQAGEVRELREEGRIHPGRLGATDDDWRGGDERDPDIHEELPAEEFGAERESPEERDAGL
jgi:hypothetical protein